MKRKPDGLTRLRKWAISVIVWIDQARRELRLESRTKK